MPAPTAPQPPSHGPCVLAFDSSTERLAVALAVADGRWTRLLDGGAAASSALLPAVDALLAQAGCVHADVDAIAFGHGPGAFTGLRTSCAVAQGLGLGLGVPLLTIDSLLIVADDAREQLSQHADTFDIVVAMDARMDEVYAGRYRWRAGRWQVIDAPALHALPAFAAAWTDSSATVVAGSAIAAFGDRLVLPAGAVRVATERDRAAALLRLAVDAARDGAGVDAASALPLYLRDKVASTTAERDAARAAAVLATAAASATR